MRKKFVGAVCAFIAASGGTAQAGAGVEGAPEGRSIDLPATAVIAGETISVGEAAQRDLSCLQMAEGPLLCRERSAVDDPLPCFGGDFGEAVSRCLDEAVTGDPIRYGDTSAVDGPATEANHASAQLDPQRRIVEDGIVTTRESCLSAETRDACAHSGDHCGRHMEVYEHNNFAGWQLILGSRQNWYNLVQGEYNDYNDNVSSFRMGEHSGHFSEHNGGYGYRYPGSTEICAIANKLTSGWNDRISSRWRN
jgi:hypothetical protein